MSVFHQAILRLVLIVSAVVWVGTATAAENQVFKAAEQEFLDGLYQRAEADFADFIQKYPASPRVADAVLYQAEARIKLGNFDGALNLLSTNQAQSGPLADWYLLCQGEALLAKGEYARAEADFSKLIQQFPGSPRRLTAIVNAALARMRLSKWTEVIDLLDQTNGTFQLVAGTNHANPDVIRGYLLLSEAQLAQNNPRAAEFALQALAASPLDPTNNWQRQYLLCRALAADRQLESALQDSTNLLLLADATAQSSLKAQSVAFQAGLFEGLGRREEAVLAYQKNVGAGIPKNHQQHALLKITQLSMDLGKAEDAAQFLQSFLTQFPTNECSDLALLTLGEVRLHQFQFLQATNQSALSTNAPALTNLLDQAVSAFQRFSSVFPRSALQGKAQLDLGWCYWVGTNLVESRAAFQRAVSLLPASPDQAQALFKLGDAEFQLTNYPAAISDYNRLVEAYHDSIEVRTNLCEPALYQIVRASQEANDLGSATNALAKLLNWFPEGLYASRALAFTGQQLGQHFPELARELYCSFAQNQTNSPLFPELQLAIARTYEAEEKWDDAIRQYDSLLVVPIDEEHQGRAEYFRARANDRAGHVDNAFLLFTNFVTRFPTNEYAPLAKWWVGDYFLGAGNFLEAESNYKDIFRNTNWAMLPIAFEARMMAGRAASLREGWDQAHSYFTGLANDRNCPADLRAKALFAYGDTLLTQGSTNSYREAFNVYDLICKSYPSNSIAALAWGQKAICLLQFAQFAQDFSSISNDFQQVLDAPQAGVMARSAAEVGLAVTLEKLADTLPDPDKTRVLNLALSHYTRVFYDNDFLREGEKPDPFWTRKAGMEVGRLAERLQLREQAINVYRRLEQMFPPLNLDDRVKALKTRA